MMYELYAVLESVFFEVDNIIPDFDMQHLTTHIRDELVFAHTLQYEALHEYVESEDDEDWDVEQ